MDCLLESLTRNSWDVFTSVGCIEADSDELLKFFAQDEGSGSGAPRLYISRILVERESVIIERSITITDVTVEKNNVLFSSAIAAESFAKALSII